MGKSERQLNRLWAPWGQGPFFILSCIFRAKRGVCHAEGVYLVSAEWINHNQMFSLLRYKSTYTTPLFSHTSAGCALPTPWELLYKVLCSPAFIASTFTIHALPYALCSTSLTSNHLAMEVAVNKCSLNGHTNMRRERSVLCMSPEYNNALWTPGLDLSVRKLHRRQMDLGHLTLKSQRLDDIA